MHTLQRMPRAARARSNAASRQERSSPSAHLWHAAGMLSAHLMMPGCSGTIMCMAMRTAGSRTLRPMRQSQPSYLQGRTVHTHTSTEPCSGDRWRGVPGHRHSRQALKSMATGATRRIAQLPATTCWPRHTSSLSGLRSWGSCSLAVCILRLWHGQQQFRQVTHDKGAARVCRAQVMGPRG